MLEALGCTPLRGDLLPENSIVMLGSIPWEMYEILKKSARTMPASTSPKKSANLPVVIIQTSRPKAKVMIEQITKSGGLTGLCFTMGFDQWRSKEFQLGVVQLGNGENQVFREYDIYDSAERKVYTHIRQKWDQEAIKTEKICGVLICQGVTGKNRGQPPELKDILMLIELPFMDSKDLLSRSLELNVK